MCPHLSIYTVFAVWSLSTATKKQSDSVAIFNFQFSNSCYTNDTSSSKHTVASYLRQLRFFLFQMKR